MYTLKQYDDVPLMFLATSLEHILGHHQYQACSLQPHSNIYWDTTNTKLVPCNLTLTSTGTSQYQACCLQPHSNIYWDTTNTKLVPCNLTLTSTGTPPILASTGTLPFPCSTPEVWWEGTHCLGNTYVAGHVDNFFSIKYKLFLQSVEIYDI